MSTLKYFSCIVLLSFQTLSAQNFWHKANGPFGDVEVTDLCLTKNGILLAYVAWSGLYYTTNSGEDWTKTNYQGYEPPNPLETINDSIFIVGGYEHTYVSNDTGKTWTATGNFDVKSMYYESISQLLYVGTNNGYPNICGIYRSIDSGNNWDLIYSFQQQSEGQWVHSLFVSKVNHVILASVIYSSQFGQYYRFFKSPDDGQTWEMIYESQYFYIRQQLEDDTLNLFALAGTSGNRLLVSEDEGETWIIKNNPETESIASDYNGRIYRALSRYIWYSVDKGNTWIEVNNSGLTGVGIRDIVINQNNRIFLATTSGVYVGEADSIVLSSEKFEPVKTFSLSQNFPNPFNPVTIIKFTIPSATLRQAQSDINVTLKVYDILGNEIATLVNEEKPADTYEVEFSAKGGSASGGNAYSLPSGIYFYQLKAGNFVETKKMILLK